MLTRLLLDFRHKEMSQLYARDNQKYYVRAVIVSTVLLFVLALTVEIITQTASGDDQKPFEDPIVVSAINWVMVAIFGMMCFCIRKALWMQKLICPLLTIQVFILAISSVPNDFDIGGKQHNSAELFAKGAIGTSAAFYLLVMLNEAWIINLGVFIILQCLTLARVSSWMGDEVDAHQIAIIGLF